MRGRVWHSIPHQVPYDCELASLRFEEQEGKMAQPRMQDCADCEGTGDAPDGTTCPTCGGTGKMPAGTPKKPE